MSAWERAGAWVNRHWLFVLFAHVGALCFAVALATWTVATTPDHTTEEPMDSAQAPSGLVTSYVLSDPDWGTEYVVVVGPDGDVAVSPRVRAGYDGQEASDSWDYKYEPGSNAVTMEEVEAYESN